jgi:hypothetical protein
MKHNYKSTIYNHIYKQQKRIVFRDKVNKEWKSKEIYLSLVFYKFCEHSVFQFQEVHSL